MKQEDLVLQFVMEMATDMVNQAYGEEQWDDDDTGNLVRTSDAQNYYEKEKKYLLDWIAKDDVLVEIDGDQWKLTRREQHFIQLGK